MFFYKIFAIFLVKYAIIYFGRNTIVKQIPKGFFIMNTVKINKGTTLMVAHRGVSGLERENTAAAFVAAGNRSYYGVETDIHRTYDGKFIISHDGNTARTSSGLRCEIEKTSYDVLRNIPLTDTDGRPRADLCLPSLEEYVRICARYEKVCVLEIKGSLSEEDTQNMINVITAENYLHNVIFISFGYENLVKVKNILPDQPAQYLCGELDDAMLERLVNDKIDIDIDHPHVNKEFVDKAHAMGLKINCWTVDNPERAQALVEMGVDFITTNILE